MGRKYLYLLVIPILGYAEMTDYGVRGNTFEIKDKNFLHAVMERGKDIDTKKLEGQFLQSVNKYLINKNSSVSTCLSTRERSYEPIIELKKDIILPYTNDVLKKKGSYNILEEMNMPMEQYFFFVDTNSPRQVEMALNYASSPGADKSITFVVVNGALNTLLDSGINAIKADKALLGLMDVKCTPSVVVQNQYKFQINEYHLQSEAQ